MNGIEKSYCSVCIGALTSAWRALMESSAAELLVKSKYGKGDTLGLDAIPEIVISKRLNDFDRHSILITEEQDKFAQRRWPADPSPILQPLIFFSDPTDRSKFLKMFFEKVSEGSPTKKIGELLAEKDSVKIWEDIKDAGAPASITGATSSITCVRKGEIIFSVILNYITREIFIACSIGTLWVTLPKFDEAHLDSIDLEYVRREGKTLNFPPSQLTCPLPDDHKRFVTFLGKEGYAENFHDSMIFVDEPDKFLHQKEPGGPSRILYLSELQKNFGSIGFILANGEKIGEWIHWLAFAKFVKNEFGKNALSIFEISLDRPWTKEGVLMSTSPIYSVFCEGEELTSLDLSRFKYFPLPSRFRSMLLVTPSDNERIIYIMRKHKYREIRI